MELVTLLLRRCAPSFYPAKRPDLRLNFLGMPRWQAQARSPTGRLNPRQLAGEEGGKAKRAPAQAAKPLNSVIQQDCGNSSLSLSLPIGIPTQLLYGLSGGALRFAPLPANYRRPFWVFTKPSVAIGCWHSSTLHDSGRPEVPFVQWFRSVLQNIAYDDYRSAAVALTVIRVRSTL